MENMVCLDMMLNPFTLNSQWWQCWFLWWQPINMICRDNFDLRFWDIDTCVHTWRCWTEFSWKVFFLSNTLRTVYCNRPRISGRRPRSETVIEANFGVHFHQNTISESFLTVVTVKIFIPNVKIAVLRMFSFSVKNMCHKVPQKAQKPK